MYGQEGAPWGARSVGFVAANGVATQLFPVGAPFASMADTTTVYPPAGGGAVRRPIDGKISRLAITSDGINAVTVEVWDCGGLDRSGANNVNNGDTVTNAFLVANGVMLEKIDVQPVGGAGSPLANYCMDVAFQRGLCVRVVGAAGAVTIAPYICGGFSVRQVAP